MRLKKNFNLADEELTRLINEGHSIFHNLKHDLDQKVDQGVFDPEADYKRYEDLVNAWGYKVEAALEGIFPNKLEINNFLRSQPKGLRHVTADKVETVTTKRLGARLMDLIDNLEMIRTSSLPSYLDLPVNTRLYVEDIDSFARVRDVNPAQVKHLLDSYGKMTLGEEKIKQGLEKILNEKLSKEDWGGKDDDLYASKVLVNNARITTAFLIKGQTARYSVLQLKHCGKKGDQIVSLFQSPADLFVVQFAGNISESVIKEVEEKVNQKRAQGSPACYCIMNGLDTARLLFAYKIIS